tara:strand:- start:938 stop:1165 length:228 start_codon:yes stop_codon:yes gene_type:complete
MDYSKKTTDELVTKIVTEIGVPLPTYDYNDYKKYISVLPQNISFGNGVMGVENADMHDTFRNACMRVISWYEETK